MKFQSENNFEIVSLLLKKSLTRPISVRIHALVRHKEEWVGFFSQRTVKIALVATMNM